MAVDEAVPPLSVPTWLVKKYFSSKVPEGVSMNFWVVTRDTVDADFAQHRQRFLAEQGYSYRIIDADDIHSGSWET